MQPSDDRPPPADRPGTPPRPPYSPVTPVLSHLAPVPNNGFPASTIIPPPRSPSPTSRVAPSAGLVNGLNIHPDSAPAPVPAPTAASAFTSTSTSTQPPFAPPPPQAPSFEPEPTPVPISESENPDAIALRSALSILQLQKQQSLRDIRALERLKVAAAADPEGFARELAAGKLSTRAGTGEAGFVNFANGGEGDGDDEEEEEGDDKGGGDGQRARAGFGTIPTPQNVVRMPPVNWAKYQIVGEPLDRMHEDQQRRPVMGEPRREDLMQRAPEHVVAAPYRPLVDKLETPGKVKGASKSKKT